MIFCREDKYFFKVFFSVEPGWAIRLARAHSKFVKLVNEMQENTVKPSWILNAGNHIIS